VNEHNFYPEKPQLTEQKQKGGMSLTFFSLVLFILVFYLLVDELNFIIYLVTVLLIHELGHFIAMKLFKYKNVRMLFIPLMGAFVQGVKSNYSQKESLLVTAAGPFPGIFLGGVCVYLGSLWNLEMLVSVGILFYFLNIINLLPLDPLDGGQLFKLLVRKNNEIFIMIFAFVSSIIMIGIGWYFYYMDKSGLILMLFGFVMGFRVRAMQKKYEIHKELKGNGVDYTSTYKLLSNEAYAKIKRVVLEYTPTLQKYMGQVSDEELDPIFASQVNNILVTPLKRDTSLLFRILVIVFWIGSFALPYFFFMNLNLQPWMESINAV
tara:strand:- start:3775 stop:4737 length:963 start_codon:yes stop_codon:yes gene_type:complete